MAQLSLCQRVYYRLIRIYSIFEQFVNLPTVVKTFHNWPDFFLDLLNLQRDQLFHIYELKNGLKFKARARTADRLIILETARGCYQPLGFEILPGHIVVDIGGHIGDFAIIAAKQGARVYTFEPERSNRELLISNIDLNAQSNIEVSSKAVSDRKEVARININPNNTGCHSLVREYSRIFQTVEATTLDEIMDGILEDRIDFLKIDAEGAEFDILFSCSVKTLDRVHKIALEFHHFQSNRNINQLVDLLQKNGFTVRVKTQLFAITGMLYAQRST